MPLVTDFRLEDLGLEQFSTATLFAQLPNGPTVAVSLSSLMGGGGAGSQQQQVRQSWKEIVKTGPVQV